MAKVLAKNEYLKKVGLDFAEKMNRITNAAICTSAHFLKTLLAAVILFLTTQSFQEY